MPKRILWADSLKGLLMILVILGHSVQFTLGENCFHNHLWNIIYSFHMPAFMALSGWIASLTQFKYANNEGWVNKYLQLCAKRAKQLLLPYFAWSIIQYIRAGNYTLERILCMITEPDSYFWFLWVLFWICITFKLTQYLAYSLHKNDLLFNVFVCVFLCGVMALFNVRIAGFQFFAYYYLFYTLGYYCRNIRIFNLSINIGTKLLLSACFIIWLFLAWNWEMHSLPQWINTRFVPTVILQYLYRGVTAVIAIFIIINISPILFQTKSNSFLLTIGEISLGFYCVHLTIIGYLLEIISKWIPNISEPTIVVVLTLCTLVVSYVIVKLIHINDTTSRILLGKN